MDKEIPPEFHKDRFDLPNHQDCKKKKERAQQSVFLPSNSSFCSQLLMVFDPSNSRNDYSMSSLHQETIEEMLQARFESIISNKFSQNPEMFSKKSFQKVCRSTWNKVYSEAQEVFQTFNPQEKEEIDPDYLQEEIQAAGNNIFKLQRQLRFTQQPPQ